MEITQKKSKRQLSNDQPITNLYSWQILEQQHKKYEIKHSGYIFLICHTHGRISNNIG